MLKKFTILAIFTMLVMTSLTIPAASAATRKPINLVATANTAVTTENGAEIRFSWNDLTQQPYVGETAEVEYTISCYDKNANLSTVSAGKNLSATFEDAAFNKTYYCTVSAYLTNYGWNVYLTNSGYRAITTPEAPKDEVTTLENLEVNRIERAKGVYAYIISYEPLKVYNGKIEYKVFKITPSGFQNVYTGDKTSVTDTPSEDERVYGYYVQAVLTGDAPLILDSDYVMF